MPATVLVLLFWAGLGFVLTGCGALVLSRSVLPVSAIEAFWVGLAALLCLGNLWHLLRPLDVWFWAAPVAAAGAGWWRVRLRRGEPLVSLTVAVFAVWVAGHALAPLSSPDAAVYHVQVVRWYADAAVVPGLGNLNPYAAFNHAYFILPAAFGLGPFADRGWHLVNGLLVVAAMPLPATAALRLLRGRTELTAVLVFTTLLAARLFDAPLMMSMSGPTADVAALAGGVFLLSRAANRPTGPAWVSGLLLAAVLSLKPTSLGVVLAAALAEWRWPERWHLRETGSAVALAAASLLPWLGHGIVLSGYLIYPVASLRLPLDWAVPSAIAESLQGWAWAFARWPAHSVAEVEAGWARHWLERELLHNRDFLLPAATSVIGAAGLAAISWWRRPSANTLALGGAVGVGLLVWWVTLPDLRFAGASLWALAGVSLGAIAELLDQRRYLVGLLVTALVLGAFLGPEEKVRWASEVPSVPESDCRPARLSTGEWVCEARSGDRCFKKECARVSAETIGTRRPPELSSGFRAVVIDGGTP